MAKAEKKEHQKKEMKHEMHDHKHQKKEMNEHEHLKMAHHHIKKAMANSKNK